jgi:predicted N-acetyltransferase YhbS
MGVRRAGIADLNTIYMMGFDAWGEGRTQAAYLELCRGSAKYAKGQWFVRDAEQQSVSSLILYADEFDLPAGCCGIGSVATAPEHRGKGHASRLVTTVVGELEASPTRGVYLFSEIGSDFYAKLGFEPVRIEQPYAECICMVRPFRDPETLLSTVPTYF